MRAAGRSEIKDLILPLAVVAVVGMMVFPLPPFILDILLVLNISFSLALLVSAVYLAESERFTSLPAILLLATLFRLGLNISTTRQLLAHGEAPDVVVAFGEFVVSGNLVVGVVIFVIVTLVQFLVIAKGAERVAEVAARFTLDAMPGKQMSIDADVRGGILSLTEAREKRRELQRESKLFGALDGAMKFVKGDAIAGLLITLINISAGLVLGVTQQGLGLSAALHKYTLFTVGDGLVSQIPALLVAVAAGIAVTRVEDKEGSFVGRDMFKQLAREPQSLSTTGGVLLVMGVLPGLPALPFLCMGGVLVLIAYKARQAQRAEERERREVEFHPKILSPFVLRISPKGTLLLQSERHLPPAVQTLRNEVFERWGVVVPDISFEIDYEAADISAVVLLHGNMLRRIRQVTGNGFEGFSEQLVSELRVFLERHLGELVDDTQTRTLLDVHHSLAEDLINSVIPTVLTVTALTTILRQLVLEGVSIRELPKVLQAVSEFHLQQDSGVLHVASLQRRSAISKELEELRARYGSSPSELKELLAHIRIALSRSISRSVCDESWCVEAYSLSPSIDNLLSRAAFSGMALKSELVDGLLESAHELLAQPAEDTARDKWPVVVCSRFARSALASLLQGDNLSVKVVSVDELSSEVRLRLVGELTANWESEAEEQEQDEESNEGSAHSNVMQFPRLQVAV